MGAEKRGGVARGFLFADAPTQEKDVQPFPFWISVVISRRRMKTPYLDLWSFRRGGDVMRQPPDIDGRQLNYCACDC